MRIRAIVLLAFAATVGPTVAQEARPVVYRVPIEGMIDLGLAPFVQRVLDEATERRGRRGHPGDQYLRRTRGRRRADPRRAAAHAGPHRGLREQARHLGRRPDQPGRHDHRDGGRRHDRSRHAGQMGQPGAPAQPVAEKTVSYVRKEFRATAESRGRPPLLAEAMVDADVEIPGRHRQGQAPHAHHRGGAQAQARRLPRRHHRGRARAAGPGRGGGPPGLADLGRGRSCAS